MDTDYPVFRKLLNMFVINYNIYFEVQVLNTLEFNYHYHCFVIQILFQIHVFGTLPLFRPHYFTLHPSRFIPLKQE